MRRVEERLDSERKSLGIHYIEGSLNVVCPWHGWEFDVRTGRHVGLGTVRLAGLLRMADAGAVSGPTAKDVFEKIYGTGRTAEEVVASEGLRRIDDEIPRDLETIILQAIRRDPDERYYSVDAFGADLGRFLNGERIRAKRPSRWRKWWGGLVRRNAKRR